MKVTSNEYWFSAEVPGKQKVLTPPGLKRLLQIQAPNTHVGIQIRGHRYAKVVHPRDAFDYSLNANGDLVVTPKAGVNPALYHIAIWGGKRTLVEWLKFKFTGPQ
jgi:hypothetical protein